MCSHSGFAYRRGPRLAWINALKVARGCADCRYNAHPAALEFDHLPGTVKRSTIGTLVGTGLPMPLIEEELAKCEVVCAICHRIRTAERRQSRSRP
jgi:hypothetical protein